MDIEQFNRIDKIIEKEKKQVRINTINEIINLIYQDKKIKEFHNLLMKIEGMKKKDVKEFIRLCEDNSEEINMEKVRMDNLKQAKGIK